MARAHHPGPGRSDRSVDGPAERQLSVVFVVTSLHGGGAEAVGRSWMQWMASRGHEIAVAQTSGKDTSAFTPPGVQVTSLGQARGHVGKTRALRQLLLSTSPHAVVALQSYPNLLTLAAGASLPRRRRPSLVVSERNLVTPGLRGAPLGHLVKHRLLEAAYPLADRVVAISHPVAAELLSGPRRGGGPQRCVVVPNPTLEAVPAVPARPAVPSDGPAGPARAVPGGGASRSRVALDSRTDEPVVVVIAHRLVEQKRPLLAVEVVAELRRRRPARLVVFGDGPLKAPLEAAARELGVEVDFRGWVEDWPERCPSGSVHLLASSREGFGNVLVEAAAAGIPSVAVSQALGVADAVVPGLSGVLADDDSPTSLADAVLAAAALPMQPDVLAPWLDRYTRASSGRMLEALLLRTCSDDTPRRAQR
ncbi:Glycosyltransferase involved in cell wall bisynthesis [Quadrisphaera granulorum]|uniref:Glycosyltransferase involved in cell wall biosynthesis n=1 Tax=Quadrisphaera granulorum TaxID=317664 RepID=A0A315ZSV9_9ACTN|nr:glycosyltransferase involved in cell wall biosynthesis [Quadrisphaera granulorum]SZE98358.1 Glycosyltransferase involved in cell wall bisynthesis [Quadrisphaera granulorum]